MSRHPASSLSNPLVAPRALVPAAVVVVLVVPAMAMVIVMVTVVVVIIMIVVVVIVIMAVVVAVIVAVMILRRRRHRRWRHWRRCELEHLLERRAVRSAHRVGDEARRETGPPRGVAPCGGVRPLGGRKSGSHLIDHRPERRAARVERTLAAVTQSELAVDGIVEQRAQVLVNVGL